MSFGASITSAIFISLGISGAWASEEGPFRCPRGIGAHAGDAPRVLLVLEEQKRAVLVCGYFGKMRSTKQEYFTEFDIWDMKIRDGSRVAKADRILRVLAGEYYWVSRLEGKRAIALDRLVALPTGASKPSYVPLVRRVLSCEAKEGCRLGKPACALPDGLSVLTDDERGEYEKESKNSLTFFNDRRGLHLAVLLSSALKGDKGSRTLLEKLNQDPRRDGAIGEDFRTAVEYVSLAAEAGCPGL